MRLRDGRPSVPLFLVHGGRGQLAPRADVLDAMGREQPIYAFRAHGLGAGEAPRRTLAEMAEDYLAAMRQVQPSGPYYLGGFCAGAWVTVEMAVRLQEAGERVAPLLLIDPPAPMPSLRPAFVWTRRAGLALAASAVRVDAGRRLLRLFTRERIGAASGALRVWVAFRRAAYAHRPRPYDGPVDVIASRARAGAFPPGHWERYCTGPTRTAEVSRDHAGIFAPSNRETAVQLTRYTTDARAWLAREAGRRQPAGPSSPRALAG